MFWKKEWKKLLSVISVFILIYFLPVGWGRFDNAVNEALALSRWYAREHVILCLLPAFFLAGAIAVFVSRSSVMKYLGPCAKKVIAYSVSSVSGSVLAVCSCTVLPLFAGIRKMGAGLGPAVTFLYSGPAINVLAIILTANILGLKLGIARAVAAVLFSIIIGLLMHLIYRKEEMVDIHNSIPIDLEEETLPLWKTAVYFFIMIAILVFINWGHPDKGSGIWYMIYDSRWIISTVLSVILGIVLVVWFDITWWKVALVALITVTSWLISDDQPLLVFSIAIIGLSVILSTGKNRANEWFNQSWGFAKQILPLLLFGVIAAGFLFGRPGHEGLVPSTWVGSTVGGNSIISNLVASLIGAVMYFATLTEVPILQGLLGAGMGQGPALALLLSGPALSLPNMLVIRSVLGTQKTVVYVLLVIVMSTLGGFLYGTFIG